MAPKMKSPGLTFLVRMYPNVGHGLTLKATGKRLMITPDTKVPDLTMDTVSVAARRPSARCQRYYPAKTGCLIGRN
jgi:hypothetical protein